MLGTFSCKLNYSIVDQVDLLFEDPEPCLEEQGSTPKDSDRKSSLTLSEEKKPVVIEEKKPVVIEETKQVVTEVVPSQTE